MAAIISAVKPLLPPPPPGAPGPLALSNEGALREFAATSGLSPAEIFDVSAPWDYPDLATALRGLKSSGVSARAIEYSGEAALESAYANSLELFRQPNGTYLIGATLRCLVARVRPSR